MTLTHSYIRNLHWARGGGCQISCNELRRHLLHSCSGVYSSAATFCSSSYLLPLTSITLNHSAPRCLRRPRPLLSLHLCASSSSASAFHSLSALCSLRLLRRQPLSFLYAVASNHPPVKLKKKKKVRRVFLRRDCERDRRLNHPNKSVKNELACKINSPSFIEPM